MSSYDAERIAGGAQARAIDAVNVIQNRGVVSDDDRYREYLALAVAGLAQAVAELAKSAR